MIYAYFYFIEDRDTITLKFLSDSSHTQFILDSVSMNFLWRTWVFFFASFLFFVSYFGDSWIVSLTVWILSCRGSRFCCFSLMDVVSFVLVVIFLAAFELQNVWFFSVVSPVSAQLFCLLLGCFESVLCLCGSKDSEKCSQTEFEDSFLALTLVTFPCSL